jgi:pimeloyl-ACP methyl ester carboxylesterase
VQRFQCPHRDILLFAAVALLLVTSIATPNQALAATDKNDKIPKAESHRAKLDGARIHYVNYGKGDEALVLIHGWTQSADAWRDNVADLAARSRVIVVELPGHGQTDKPKVTYSMDYFARAVEAVMRDAKVKRAVLVGHSMGTPVARQFYRKYPEQTLAIVIVDGSLRPFDNKAMLDQLIAGLRGPKYRDVIDQMFGMMFGPALSAESRQLVKASTENTPQYVLASAFESVTDPSIWGEDKINVPVLAIMAKNPFLPPNVEESFRAIAPQMEFHMWEGVGHFIMMEKPKEFNAAVIQWLDKNRLLKK